MRELDAVNEWLNKTNKTLHIMRDNKSHKEEILAGMWGLRITEENRMKMRDMREKMFTMAYTYVRPKIDQPLLKVNLLFNPSPPYPKKVTKPTRI